MEHSIPYYGEAVFRTRAGEASGFYLKADTSRFKAGEAQVVAASPIWMSQPSEEVIATIGMKQGTRPVWLGKSVTELMLAKLNAGKEVHIVRPTWYESQQHDAKLAMSTIGFRKAYERYLRCLSGLIPRNFDQLKRTALLFPGGKVDALPSSITRQLDHILTLVKHDQDVKQFFIDGHTDSVGDRIENLELSKLRAELVGDYLTRRGIPEEWVKVRWHGERYPVASNANSSGRAKNRRVTVRLEKVKEPETLSLAQN
jgi:outer membrane protein OmpA-like peptidoglycan-associated protein